MPRAYRACSGRFYFPEPLARRPRPCYNKTRENLVPAKVFFRGPNRNAETAEHQNRGGGLDAGSVEKRHSFAKNYFGHISYSMYSAAGMHHLRHLSRSPAAPAPVPHAKTDRALCTQLRLPVAECVCRCGGSL